jgi:predicted dinucleotide-binding enzyme
MTEPALKEALGFIGLGAMGAPMVRRLLEAGHRVLAHDLNPVALAAAVSRGAEGRDSPAAVAGEAAIVLVSLPTPEVVRQVALGAAGLAEGDVLRIYVDLSTTGAQAVAACLAPRGVVALDAPVSGGVAGAEAGTLAVMAADDRAAFDRVRPVPEVIGANTVLVGGQPGQGRASAAGRTGCGRAPNLALLVNRKDNGMGWRIDVEADVVADLPGEARVVRELEPPHPMRLQAMAAPVALHRADAAGHRHRRCRSVHDSQTTASHSAAFGCTRRAGAVGRAG